MRVKHRKKYVVRKRQMDTCDMVVQIGVQGRAQVVRSIRSERRV